MTSEARSLTARDLLWLRVWLSGLDLYVDPFIEGPPIRLKNKISDGGTRKPVYAVPLWVLACWQFGKDEEAVKASTTFGREVRTEWRRFLVYVMKDEGLRAALEAVWRLGDEERTAHFVAKHFERVIDALDDSPVCSRVAALHATRERRLDGRAQRPEDAAYAAEALPPGIAPKRTIAH